MKDHCKKALANVGAADDVCDVSNHVTSGAMAESVWRSVISISLDFSRCLNLNYIGLALDKLVNWKVHIILTHSKEMLSYDLFRGISNCKLAYNTVTCRSSQAWLELGLLGNPEVASESCVRILLILL